MTYIQNTATEFIRVTGKDRIDFLHRLSTQDLKPLQTPYQRTTTAFTNAQGKMIDWVTVLSTPDAVVLITAPGRAEILKEWIERYVIMEDVQLQIQQAYHVIQEKALEQPVSERDGMLWFQSLDVYPNRCEALSPHPIAGSAPSDHFETQRLLAGVPSSEHEYIDEINPLELRLAKHAIGWKKGCYIGQEVISRLDSYNKLARVLTGFESREALPAGDHKITQDGKIIGRVTSFINNDQGAIGLAIVKRECADEGEVIIHGINAKLVSRPFWK